MILYKIMNYSNFSKTIYYNLQLRTPNFVICENNSEYLTSYKDNNCSIKYWDKQHFYD